ncbi:hypothetical protein [Sphingobium abikonense]|uniref:hypothetical protein n=1 Tax=Sphingobium abikonense TaxID=86193 RepID=UPI0035116530
MSRWFRHYAGMMRDDKLVRAALKAKQSVERTLWVWGAILESAAEIDDEARYEVDPAEIAHFLRCKPAHIEAIIDALKDLGRIDGERVSTWSKRQFKSDRSNDRVTEYRRRKKTERNADVTLQERHRNAPETETETEVPLSNDNGPAADPDVEFWRVGKAFLSGESKNPGALIGKWSQRYGKAETAAAITRAQLERPVQRIPFIEGCLRQNGKLESAGMPC